jgi:hypothetical protein
VQWSVLVAVQSVLAVVRLQPAVIQSVRSMLAAVRSVPAVASQSVLAAAPRVTVFLPSSLLGWRAHLGTWRRCLCCPQCLRQHAPGRAGTCRHCADLAWQPVQPAEELRAGSNSNVAHLQREARCRWTTSGQPAIRLAWLHGKGCGLVAIAACMMVPPNSHKSRGLGGLPLN